MKYGKRTSGSPNYFSSSLYDFSIANDTCAYMIMVCVSRGAQYLGKV